MSFRRRSSLVLAWFVGVGRLQLLVQSSLAVGEPLWHVNLKPHVEVAGAASSEAGQSLPDEAQDRVRLRARGHVDGLLAVEERHVNLDAEDRIDDVDGFGAVKVAAAPLEPRILGGADDDKEIAGRRPRLLGGQAMAGDAQRPCRPRRLAECAL